MEWNNAECDYFIDKINSGTMSDEEIVLVSRNLIFAIGKTCKERNIKNGDKIHNSVN